MSTAVADQVRQELPSVAADLYYFRPTAEKIALYVPPENSRPHEMLVPHRVLIRDGRPLRSRLSLDVHGFTLVRHQHPLKSFSSDLGIKAVYYPFLEQLVKDMTGASKVLFCAHNVRMSDAAGLPPSSSGNVDEAKLQNQVYRVHTDATMRSGVVSARNVLAAAGLPLDLLKWRFAMVNVWQPIQGPVARHPLAVCDARTVAPADLVVTRIIKDGESSGTTFSATFSPRHRWFYFPQMTTDEALLFKSYDSAVDGRARFVPHASFEDPMSAPDAPPRHSVEVRTVALFAPRSAWVNPRASESHGAEP